MNRTFFPLLLLALAVPGGGPAAPRRSRAGRLHPRPLFEIRISDPRCATAPKLFACAYVPNELGAETWPILLLRTYDVGPYGSTTRRHWGRAPTSKRKFIFVLEDVRGRYMSEGDYVNDAAAHARERRQDVDEKHRHP